VHGSIGLTNHGQWQLGRVRGGRRRERSRGIEKRSIAGAVVDDDGGEVAGSIHRPGRISEQPWLDQRWPLATCYPRRTWCRWPCDRVARSGRGWVRWLQQGEAEVVVCLIGMEREHNSDWGGSFNARQWRLWRLATMDRPESEGEASESV
jgi:hypothetical protein